MNSGISIILPTYNRAFILERCIDNIILQSYEDWELIILDDDSGDDTQKIGEKYQETDSRIQYIKNKTRLLQMGNKNKGISLSKKPLIFIMEDDVLLEKDCLAELYSSYLQLSKDQKIGAIAPRLINEGQEGFVIGDKPFILNKITGEILNNYSIEGTDPVETFTLHACSVLHKEAFIDVGGFSEGRYIGNCFREETDFFFRLKQKGYNLFFIPAAVAHHKSGSTGGCKVGRRMKGDFYNLFNHARFLLVFFGIYSLIMIPCFVFTYLTYHYVLVFINNRRSISHPATRENIILKGNVDLNGSKTRQNRYGFLYNTSPSPIKNRNNQR